MSSCVLQCIPKYTHSKCTPRHIRPNEESITSREALPYIIVTSAYPLLCPHFFTKSQTSVRLIHDTSVPTTLYSLVFIFSWVTCVIKPLFCLLYHIKVYVSHVTLDRLLLIIATVHGTVFPGASLHWKNVPSPSCIVLSLSHYQSHLCLTIVAPFHFKHSCICLS